MIAPVVIVFLINSVCINSDEVTGNKCLTASSHKEGVCINLQECASIYALANNFEDKMTSEKLAFLIESQCGFNGTNPKVCCPKDEVSIN